MTLLKKWRARVASDPYKNRGVELVATSVLKDVPIELSTRGSGDEFFSRGEIVLGAAQEVIQFWNPQRLDAEALRRAADAAQPSVIAMEAALFTAFYQSWLKTYLDWAPTLAVSSNARMRADLVRSALAEALERLERLAAAVEARSTDVRLRYEFERLRIVLSGNDAAAAITEAIRCASEDVESQEHLEQVRCDLQETMGRLEAQLDGLRIENTYVADVVMRNLDAPNWRTAELSAVRLLADSTVSVAVKAVLSKIISVLNLT